MSRNRFYKKDNREFVIYNKGIRAESVRCIDSDNNNLGVISKNDALNKAYSASLDLVQISDGKDGIPICKIIDCGKYKYDLSKKKKEIAKKQRESVVKIKEIKLRPSTDINDLNTKANNAIKFLKKGDKVKVELRFRGRELGHKDIGKEVMLKFIDIVKEFGEPTKAPAFEGNSMVVMIDPKK